ncbi:MAG: hypothetical protein JXQ72_16520 [Anaerolineae bacterium]|nr:hypothetical protein [Anaerolineae bacterium]
MTPNPYLRSALSTLRISACTAGDVDPIMAWLTPEESQALQVELENQRDIAQRFTAHATAIWNKVFPGEPNGWEYGAQLERCVIQEINELRAEIARLVIRIIEAQSDSLPDEVRELLDGGAEGNENA